METENTNNLAVFSVIALACKFAQKKMKRIVIPSICTEVKVKLEEAFTKLQPPSQKLSQKETPEEPITPPEEDIEEIVVVSNEDEAEQHIQEQVEIRKEDVVCETPEAGETEVAAMAEEEEEDDDVAAETSDQKDDDTEFILDEEVGEESDAEMVERPPPRPRSSRRRSSSDNSQPSSPNSDSSQSNSDGSEEDKSSSPLSKRRRTSTKAKSEKHRSGKWTEEEHRDFLRGLAELGHNWRKISREYVTTRSRTQVASHAQTYFLKLEKDAKKNRS